MNLGPTELLIILAIIFVLGIPAIVAVIFLARHRGFDDSDQVQAYPPGWQPPPASPPPPPPDHGTPPPGAGPPPPSA